MTQVTFTVPAGLERTVTLTSKEFEREVRLMAALKMFELGKMSMSAAAQLAGVSRVEFIDLCAQYEVPVSDFSEDELRDQLERMEAWTPVSSLTQVP